MQFQLGRGHNVKHEARTHLKHAQHSQIYIYIYTTLVKRINVFRSPPMMSLIKQVT